MIGFWVILTLFFLEDMIGVYDWFLGDFDLVFFWKI
jgi:hypothetical protein